LLIFKHYQLMKKQSESTLIFVRLLLNKRSQCFWVISFPCATGQTMQTAYGYNNRNELISAQTTVNATPVAGRTFGYAFDPIGNRTGEEIDDASHSYTANELNQYTQRQTPWWLPVSGIANRTGGASIEVSGTQ
jgi:hypothetical protein